MANLRDLIAATGLVILLKTGFKSSIFGPCNIEIWWMTLKNNRAPPLYYVKLCASFQSNWWIQTGVTVRKFSICVNIGDFFLSCVTLKFEGWPWKSKGHLYYTTSSFLYHFKAISEFKQNRPFFACVTLQFDRWPWKTIEHLFYTTSSFMRNFKATSEFKLEL